MTVNISPFAPSLYTTLPPLFGINIGIGASGLRYKDRDDFFHILLTCPAPIIAGVFTQNHIPSEPVKWCQNILPCSPRSIVAWSGNANACTGMQGFLCLEESAAVLNNIYHSDNQQIYFAMTGVIGEIPNSNIMTSSIKNFPPSPINAELWYRAAKSIMTTDTYPKLYNLSVAIDSETITLCGISKGSGMIAPNMATMLSFLFTDIKISQKLLQQALYRAIDNSFNSISVDSDTSTSDTVLLVSTGLAHNTFIQNDNSNQYIIFENTLKKLCHCLAMQIISDGEGITKRLDINITGAYNKIEAKIAGMAIANSPLVKVAIHSNDPNWGRIMMALGKSGVNLASNKIRICFGDIVVVSYGKATHFSSQLVDYYLKQRVINISVDLGVGTAKSCVWGNDLSPDYIQINANYRS